MERKRDREGQVPPKAAKAGFQYRARRSGVANFPLYPKERFHGCGLSESDNPVLKSE
jgi:hypothetical protein